MATADYRAQARAVRAEARRKLHEFRRERRAALTGPAAEAAPAAAAPEADFSDIHTMQVSAEAAAFAGAHEFPAAETAAPEVEPSEGPAPEPIPEPAPEPMPEPAPDPAPAVEAAASIETLPGVGPGLVWLLRKAGVDTVEALLASDSQALSDRLGLVGRLVDVDALKSLAAQPR